MKFRATLKDPAKIAAICKTASGFHKKVIIKLHEDRVRFITSTGLADGTQVWTSCRSENLFADLRLEASRENTIYIEVDDISLLFFAMRQCEQATTAAMKLARHENTQLLRVMYQHRHTLHDVSQDIPIHVLGESEISAIVAPPLERDVVQVVLPNLSEISLFTEKVRSSAHGALLTFAAARAVPGGPTSTNLFTITANTFTATFSLQYQGVEMPAIAPPETRDDEDEGVAETRNVAAVTIDARRFHRFLGVREVNPIRVVAHLVEERALVLSAYAVGETNLVYYIPASVAH